MSDELRTRPMIEALMTRLDTFAQKTDAQLQALSGEVKNLSGRIDRLEGEMQQVKAELSELSDRLLFGFRKLDGKMESLSDAWLEVRSDMRDLNRRVDKLQPDHM